MTICSQCSTYTRAAGTLGSVPWGMAPVVAAAAGEPREEALPRLLHPLPGGLLDRVIVTNFWAEQVLVMMTTPGSRGPVCRSLPPTTMRWRTPPTTMGTWKMRLRLCYVIRTFVSSCCALGVILVAMECSIETPVPLAL